MPTTTKTSNISSETLVLLDTHAILHRAYHALPDFTSPDGQPTGALYGVVTMVLKIIEEFKPDYIIACFDLPAPTYRHDAFADYKGTRHKTDDELVRQIERSQDIFAAFGIPVLSAPGFEADDLLGTLAHQTAERPGLQVVIASGDMDTLQCVDKKRVKVYTLKKGIKDTVLYDEAAVKDRFGFGSDLVPDYKGLRGDASDNIPGIAGIGEKTATALITQFGSVEKIYQKLKKSEQSFLDSGIKPRIIGLLKEGEEEALFSKMLATIRIDAPVLFAPDEARWRETANPDAILKLFNELGFRSLSNRISTLFNQPGVLEESPILEIKHETLTDAAVLLWLLESDRTNPTTEDIIDYGRAHFETIDFTTIHTKLRQSIAAIPTLEAVYTDIEVPLMSVLRSVNATGITLDTKYLKTLSTKMHKELDALEATIYAAAGGVEFNINSPKQLGDVLFDVLKLKPKNQKKTAGGQRSTRESELEKMQNDHPIIRDILRYRELQKLTSTYIDALPKLVSPDGRLRTTLLQTGTTTGRLASRDPNLQNIPVRTTESKAIRKAFVAAPKTQIVSIDYSQIELRIAAMLSEDAKLVDIFTRGEDVHTGVAVRVFGVHANEVTSEMRRQAKVINFGILYGMGVNALRSNLGGDTTREAAQQFLNAYFNTFTRLAEYLEETKAAARTNGYTETLFGRRRHFPGLRSSAPFIRAQAERMAINAPIQGTQADVIRIAMNHIQTYLTEHDLLDQVHMILQVHDELLFEIDDAVQAEVLPELVRIMTSVLTPEQTLGVPINVDVAVGPNWAELLDIEI